MGPVWGPSKKLNLQKDVKMFEDVDSKIKKKKNVVLNFDIYA